MITSKQRAQLRGMAAALNTELQIGKSGITENVVRQAEEALAARELIKGRVLDNSLLSAREACDALCEACGADGVQVIGTEVVGVCPMKALVDCAEYYLQIEDFDFDAQVLENYIL